jgi:flavodoxin
MRALVVYESIYGNTKRIADAVANGIAGYMTVETMEVSTAPTVLEFEVDLLVVGGPTHVHGMTSPFTRAQAVKQATTPVVSVGIGMREWLDQLRPVAPAIPAAAFDTRIKGAAILTGSAANGYAKRLRDAGFRVVAPTESFFIATKAPQDDALLAGELDHAREWGVEIAKQLGAKLAIPVG